MSGFCYLQIESDKEKVSEDTKSEMDSDAESISKPGRSIVYY